MRTTIIIVEPVIMINIVMVFNSSKTSTEHLLITTRVALVLEIATTT